MVQADTSQTCGQSESHDLWMMKGSKVAVSPARFHQDGGVGKSCDYSLRVFKAISLS